MQRAEEEEENTQQKKQAGGSKNIQLFHTDDNQLKVEGINQ
jgi:hypothetical protein